MQGRGLLIFLFFLSLSFAGIAQEDSSTDEFSEFEEIQETPGEVEASADEPQPIPEESTAESPAEPATNPEPEPLPSVQAPPPMMSGADEPDYKTEEYFHEIYKKFNNFPTPNDNWDKATSKGKAQVYEISPKESLWAISGTLFGDNYFWPKIWSLNNDEVLNPHEISPGMKIKFFAGDLSSVPAVTLSEVQKPPVVQEGLASAEVEASKPPPPYRKTKKLKKIPESLPLYRYGVVNKPKPKVEIENLRKPIPSPLVSVTHYVIEGQLSSSGQVKETELGGKTASEFQYIIVRIDDSSAKNFYAVRVADDVVSPYRKGPRGKMVEILGEIEVLEKVSDKDNLFRAIVTKNIAPIEIGSLLMPGKLPKANVSDGETSASVEASIIGGQFSSSRRLYSKYTLVFIDAGSAGGLVDGQILNIFTNLLHRNPESKAAMRNRQIGRVKILKTSQNFSTGYILDTKEDVWIGDTVGGGSVMAAEEDQFSEF